MEGSIRDEEGSHSDADQDQKLKEPETGDKTQVSQKKSIVRQKNGVFS